MGRVLLVTMGAVIGALAPAVQSARAPQTSLGCWIQPEFRKLMTRPRASIQLALREPGNLAALKVALPKAEGALEMGQFPGCENDWQVIDARLDLAYLKQVISMTHEQRASLDRAERIKDQASWLFEKARYQEATDVQVKALDIQRELLGEAHVEYAASLSFLAILYDKLGNTARAEASYRQSLEIQRKQFGINHPLYAFGLTEAALTREKLTGESAEAAYQEALQILGRTLNPRDETQTWQHLAHATLLQNQARRFYSSGRYALAEPLLLKAVELKERFGEKNVALANVLHGLGEVYRELGDLNKAEAHYRRALETKKTAVGEEHESYLRTLNQLSLTLADEGRYYREGPENKKYGEAEKLLLAALEIKKRTTGELTDSYATSLHNLASLYRRTNRTTEAEAMLRQVLEIRKQALGTEEHISYAITLSQLAGLLQESGRVEEAVQTYRRALAIAEGLPAGNGAQIANIQSVLGSTLADLLASTPVPLERRAEAARLLLSSAVWSWSNIANQLPFMSDLQRRGLARESGFDQDVDALWTLTFQTPGLDPAAGFRGALLKKQWLFEIGRQESAALRASLAKATPEIQQAWQERERLRKRHATIAREHWPEPPPESLPPEDRFLEVQIRRLDDQLRQANPAYATSRLEQVTVEEVAAALRPGEALVEYVPYYDDDRIGRVRYGAFVVLRGGTIRAVDVGHAAEIDAAITRFRAAVRAWIDPLGRGVTPSAAQVRRSERIIGEASAAVRALVWTPIEAALERATRVYVAPDGALSLIPFEALARQDDAGGWRYLAEDLELVHLPTARDLGRLATRSPRVGGGARRAVLVGNPAFGIAPAQVASVVARVSSTGDHRARATESSATDATLGSVTGGEIRSEIPRAWEQLANLETLIRRAERQLASMGWSVKALTGEQAVEEAVLAVEAPRLLQIATHGYIVDRRQGAVTSRDKPVPHRPDNPLMRSMLFFAGANTWSRAEASFYKLDGKLVREDAARAAGFSDSDLLRARVELADGVLTAYEVTGMNLQDTELVNLTACETGLGESTPNGVVGLRQAFLLAGARAITMSMWEVPADETTAQIAEFYTRWLTAPAGVTPGRYTAFRAAQLSALARARRDRGSGHPFYWAGTVYVGDPGDLPVKLGAERSR